MARLLVSLALSVAMFASLPARANSEEFAPANPYGHLEYFGFYASAMGHWNFTSELSPFTNLTWIHVGSAERPLDSARQFVDRVREASQSRVGAVLSIEPFLFADAQGTPRSEQEIEDWLIDLRARLEIEGLLDTVVMIYPKDEPFREFRRNRDPDIYEQYISGEVYEEIHADIYHVNKVIKRVFPDTPLGAILSGYEIHHEFFSIPENYDWVGYNCYDNLFKGCEDRSAVQVYGRLLAHMQAHQRLIAVPETWAVNEKIDQADWPETLLKRLRQHYEIALSDPRFVAFIPFIWSFDAQGPTPGLGLNRFAELYDSASSTGGTRFVNRVKQFGRQIKNEKQAYPNMSYWDTEDIPERPADIAMGEILDIDGQGLVHLRAFHAALPHKRLRVQLLVSGPYGDQLFKSRVQRTTIQENLPLLDSPDNGVLPGRHGHQIWLPKQLMEAMAGKTVTIELNTYSDGVGRALAHQAKVEYQVPPPKVSRRPPAPSPR